MRGNKQPLTPPHHRNRTWRDAAHEFWESNLPVLGAIIVLTMVIILICMMGWVAASRNMTGTEANVYYNGFENVVYYARMMIL